MRFYQSKLLWLTAISIFSLAALSAQTSAAKNVLNTAEVKDQLRSFVPGIDNAIIEKSPIDNVFRLQIDGQFAFVYVDGEHVLLGDLINAKSGVNLGTQASRQLMAEKIAATSTDEMIIFAAEEEKRYITIFTDIDCGYCRRLHTEVPELNNAGISVRYVAFPRAGINSESYKKYVSVWCNDDQLKAMTSAKNGRKVASRTCDNPIAKSYELGKEVGVRGTPTIIMDDGTISPGYLPAPTLIQRLGLSG